MKILQLRLVLSRKIRVIPDFLIYVTLLVTTLVIFVPALNAETSKECPNYNLAAIDRKYFINHTKFKDGLWNDALKEATVQIDKNEQVKVKFYACEHFGLDATLSIRDFKTEPSQYRWIEKIKWLGKQVLGDEDYKLVLKAIEDKEFNKKIGRMKIKDEVVLTVEGSSYVEFLVTISASDGNSENSIDISWYY